MAEKPKRRARSGVQVREKVEGSGLWWIFIKFRGRRASRCIGDKKKAEAIAGELEAAFNAIRCGLTLKDKQQEKLDAFLAGKQTPAAPPVAPSTPMFEDYAKQYLDRVEPDPDDPEHGLKRSTWLDYKSVLKRLKPLFEGKRLGDIRRGDVKELRVKLKAAGLKPLNARKHLRVLSTVLSEAVEDELIELNPATQLRKTKRSKLKGKAKPVVVLTGEELGHLLGTARDKYPAHFPLILLLSRTGLRLGEAIALKWGDVDWQADTIHVQRSCSKGEVSLPKNGKDRFVHMSAALKAVLRGLHGARFEGVAADAEGEAGASVAKGAALDVWIFPSSTDGPTDANNFRARAWLPLLGAAEIGHRQIKVLRHTYASLLLENREDPYFVQQQLGHHDVTFTLRIYGHLVPRDRRGHVDRLDRLAPVGTRKAPGPSSETESKAPQRHSSSVAALA